MDTIPAQFARINVDERAHRHSISIHCPNCTEPEMAARCDIAAIRDRAAAMVPHISTSAAIIAAEAARVASFGVYAQIPVSQLIRAAGALRLAVAAAEAIEQALQ